MKTEDYRIKLAFANHHEVQLLWNVLNNTENKMIEDNLSKMHVGKDIYESKQLMDNWLKETLDEMAVVHRMKGDLKAILEEK